MDSANFINFLKNPGNLHQLSFQELNSLIEAYPYCQNLHYLAMMKAKVEQHKDYDKKLGLVSTYCGDRKFLFKQIQDPVKPEGTSDSHYGASEESPSESEPMIATQQSHSIVVPPTPAAPEDDNNADFPNTPEPPVPGSISNEYSEPDIRVVEDASGSQIIIKHADMEVPPKEEGRKVVFLEDLFKESEIVQEIPDTKISKVVNEEIPVESEPPATEPVLEEPEVIDDAPLTDDDIFAVESDAVSDNDMGIPVSDADTVSDQLELHDLPQENQEEPIPEAALPSINEADDLGAGNEFIEFPDHIIDNIPFEVINVADDEAATYDDEAIPDSSDDDALSEEGNMANPEQFSEIAVTEEKIIMDIEEENENVEDPENIPPEEEKEEEVAEELETQDTFGPLPKVAFKSWPGKFKPNPISQQEEPEVEAEADVEELELVPEVEASQVDEQNAIIPTKESSNALEEVAPEESKGIDLAEVIKEQSSDSVKQKSKKKRKAKKKKQKKKEEQKLEKKKAKKKAKAKKKKRIKQLAERSLTLKDDIISETLAELLVNQGSNKKAIKMYKKLSKLFPEKSKDFAAQIKKLKK